MVAPVTGPFFSYVEYKGPSINGFYPVWYSKDQWWYRQKRPYSLPLGYFLDERAVLSNSHSGSVNVSTGDAPPSSGGWKAYTSNKAYQKLRSAVGDQSLWATNLLESKRTMRMITERAIKLTKVVRALNRLDFAKVNNLLVGEKIGWRNRSKTLANLWLEYSYGIKPLVEDIGNGITTLCKQHKPLRVSGAAVSKDVSFFDTGGPAWERTRTTYDTRVRMSMDVKVISPNIHLAEQLGFINPAAVAWEAVPFSFVVDWFTNVGEVLNSWSDFAGLEISNQQTTEFQLAFLERSNWWGLRWSTRRRTMQRFTSISQPTLIVRPWKGVSPARAANAVSLLVQQLGKG